MKKNLILFSVFFIFQFLQAQIEFEKGYYVDKSGKKVQGYIKNTNWKVLPKRIVFKKTEKSKKQFIDVNSINELSIGNIRKYIRFNVDIDRSNDVNFINNNIHTDNKDYNKEPVFNNEDLLLELLVEGEYNLYKYSSNSLIRFFYSKGNEKPKQLIYKQFYKKIPYKENQYEFNVEEKRENLFFRKQVYDLADSCKSVKDRALTLLYNEKELMDVFITLNKCKNYDYKVFEVKTTSFEIWAAFSIGTNSAYYYNNIDKVNDFDFDKGGMTSYMVRLSYNPGISRRNWLIFLEGGIISRSEIKSTEDSRLTEEYDRYAIVNYGSVKLSLGLHYNFPVSGKHSLYGEVMYNFEQPSNSSKMQVYQMSGNADLLDEFYFHNALNSVSFGAGYTYNNKIRLGLSIDANRREFVLGKKEFFSSAMRLSLMYNFL